VTVVEYAPHVSLLQDTDVFVTHAGLGSCAAGLHSGVPLVCTPIDRDQPLNAARVEELGAGIATTPEGVATAVERVLGDPTFARAASEISVASRAAGGAEAAVRDLEALVG
jgi:UDP:flavonoid glycosyltransferase YjiC (YdhE family)